MSESKAAQAARAALMQSRILWAGLTFASVTFLGVLLFLGERPSQEPAPVMLPAFALLTLAIAVLSFVIPSKGHQQGISKLKLDVVSEADPNASDVIPERDAATRRVVKKPLKAVRKAFALYHTPLILGCALSESIAINGFVLGFLGFPLIQVLPFFALSWILLLVRFPTMERAIGPVEAHLDAHVPLA